MTGRRVLLRCDATPDGGMGHLVRCVALAEAARDRGWEVTVAGRVEVDLGRRLVAAAGLALVDLGPGVDDLSRLAAERGADVVHVDHYGLPADLRAALAPCLLSSTEDGAWGRRPADVVVDSTLGAAERPADGSGEVLLGVRYAPLRAEVRAARESRQARSGHDRRPGGGTAEENRTARDPAVLVVLGGTDATGAAADVVAALARVGVRGGRVTVVAPEGRHPEVVAAGRGLAMEALPPQDHLPELAASHDAVVTAAGTSVWELACVGVAMGLVQVVENQAVGYARAVDAGLALGLGTPADLASGGADGELRRLLDPAAATRLASRAAATVDGGGAARVVQAWERALRGVRVRTATVADGDLLRSWRNDPDVRAVSRSTAEVGAQEHGDWLRGVLADPHRLLLVAETPAGPVGTVRLDDEGDVWEVSITLAPGARGSGLAPLVLSAAEDEWVRRGGGRTPLLACVRPGNEASARLFLRAGYAPDPARGDDVVDAYVKG